MNGNLTADIGKVKRYLLPNLPYAALFWFFSKCGEAYRTSPENEIVFKLMDAIGNLNATISNPIPSIDPFDLCIGLICTAVICGIVWNKRKYGVLWAIGKR